MEEQTEPIIPLDENMEVHHHSHTARKKLSHYFFEFFMLFLAVVCGMLAEYYLENRIERHREHEFVESMVQDLKEDTVKISATAAHCKKQVAGQMQLINLLGTNLQNPDSVAKAYKLTRCAV